MKRECRNTRAAAYTHAVGGDVTMNRTGAMLAVGLALAGVCTGVAQARAHSPAESYFAARSKARVAVVPLETIRVHPEDYRTILIEMRGTVTGNARREDGATLI